MPRLVQRGETGVAAAILARAFAHDPVVSAFIRAGPDRPARLTRYFELECRPAFTGHGEVWLDDDLRGAAIWRRPGGYPEPLLTQLRTPALRAPVPA